MECHLTAQVWPLVEETENWAGRWHHCSAERL